LATAAHVIGSQRVGVLEQIGDSPGVDYFAAVYTRTRSDVDNPVRGVNRVFVVFDNDESVAEVAQFDEGIYEPAIVPLMKTDARFVEHIEHTGQSRADLSSQTDALRLTSGQ
jgi:hypothetical protein